MFKKNKKREKLSDEEKLAFVTRFTDSASSKKRVKLIGYGFGILFCTMCGFIGIFSLKPETDVEQKANTAAGTFFFVVALIFLVLFIVTYKRPVVVKQIGEYRVSVYSGLKNKYVYCNNRLVYKGKERNCSFYVDDGEVIVKINGKDIDIKSRF